MSVFTFGAYCLGIGLILYVQVNSYGHVGLVSSSNHTYGAPIQVNFRLIMEANTTNPDQTAPLVQISERKTVNIFLS